MADIWLLYSLNMNTYSAPWGKSLIIVSAIFTALTVSVFFAPIYFQPWMVTWGLLPVKWILPAIMFSCLPFIVRSYTITPAAILIRRLFWNTRLARESLMSAEVIPYAMKKCLRTCGNGGVFSFTGWYWSKALGCFTAYVTDQNRTVVLKYDGRTVVLSPSTPEDFVKDLER